MSRIDVILRRIEKIHKELGGNQAGRVNDTKDSFKTLQFQIEEKLHSIEATQEERKRSLESNHQ
jgi:hypothetical protein